MSYSEVHRLPIRYRHWYLDRLAQHFKMKNKAHKEAMNGMGSADKPINLNNLNI